VAVLDEMEHALQILERRGINVGAYLKRLKDGKLPTYRVLLGGQEYWLYTQKELDDFVAEQRSKHGELVVEDEPAAEGGAAKPASNGHANGAGAASPSKTCTNRRASPAALSGSARSASSPRTWCPPRASPAASRPRASWLKAPIRSKSSPLRDLVPEVRRLGEKAWHHALQGPRRNGRRGAVGHHPRPAKRTLLQVRLEEGLQADEMFRTLMGEKVEPRRDFIQKHALSEGDRLSRGVSCRVRHGGPGLRHRSEDERGDFSRSGRSRRRLHRRCELVKALSRVVMRSRVERALIFASRLDVRANITSLFRTMTR